MRKLSSTTLPWPTDWTELFGAARPLILEIGFGYGAFLLHLARQHPDASVIGLEVANKCLAHVERAVERQGLANVRVIHSTAETALYHLFEPATISQIHVNFPDPWFKKRHSQRRLMRRDTLDAMVNRLATAGEFYLATDILEYAQMSAELLAETPGLDNQLPTPWATTMPGRVMTKYEGKAQRAGRTCYYFAYRRNQQPPPDLPAIKEFDMPHVVFKNLPDMEMILSQFTPSQHTLGDVHISLMNAYRGRHDLLFEVFVKEATIDQRVAFILGKRPAEAEYTLQLSMLGHPRPTPGIHQAAAILADWLATLHPEIQVLKRKLNE